jgi:pilus assembly protein CpaB
MNKQSIIVLGGGLLVSLLVALIMQAMIGGNDQPPAQIAQIETTRVLIASKDLKIGDTLDDASMEWKTWPQDSVFEGAVIESELELEEGELALNGRLLRDVSTGEPLLKSALVDDEKGNFVAATLNPGMRAMAIKVKSETSVGGFLFPNDHVDVLLTYEVKLPSDKTIRNASASVIQKRTAQTVLENVRVVAVDQKAKDVESASIYKTITVEVDAKQAEILALANSMGSLTLALRQLGDDTVISNTTDKTATTDTRLSNVMQELLGNRNSSGTQPNVVRVYNGANVSELVVRSSQAQ